MRFFVPWLLNHLLDKVSVTGFARCGRPGFDPWVGKIPLEKEMATHSSILAWRIPWTVHGVAKSWTRLSDKDLTWHLKSFPQPILRAYHQIVFRKYIYKISRLLSGIRTPLAFLTYRKILTHYFIYAPWSLYLNSLSFQNYYIYIIGQIYRLPS